MDGVQLDVRDEVAVIRIDNGKVNALSPAVVEGIDQSLTEAAATARSVLLCGRPGDLSAGFDLKVMQGEGRDALVVAGRALLLRIFDFELPVVVACTGHAIAAGAGLVVTADWRVGAAGDFKVGFNEVAIGHALTATTIELIRYRMPPTAFESIVRGELFGPEGAVEAGLLDEVVAADEVEAVAEVAARRLGALAPEAYTAVKRRARGPALAAAQDALAREERR